MSTSTLDHAAGYPPAPSDSEPLIGDLLVAQGKIKASRIKVIGYGKHRPVASNVTEEGRQQNRRVEIDILK